jgi:mannose-6-phosphate isomerase-like protein (cupin superfamily)
MSSMAKKNLSRPDETRSFDNGKVELVNIGGVIFSRLTLQPGWKWSLAVKPIAKTNSCQVHHVGLVVSGRMHIKLDTGEETEAGPGDVYDIPPGHDAWILGNEPFVGIDVSGEMAGYAKR